MSMSAQQLVADILSEAAALEEHIDSLPYQSAAELYSILDEAARFANQNIAVIDPELRVRICDMQDRALERIVDAMPPDHFEGLRVSGVYTPAVQGFRRWSNTELLKDKGLAGYLLAREVKARSVMYFGTQPSDYPYHSDLPELELEYFDAAASEDESKAAYYEHLKKNYNDMDALILPGMYPMTIPFLGEYRALRPDGKVYCGLDMNGRWMKRIKWGGQAVSAFSRMTNVVATSCRSLRDALNRNPDVSFACRWMPNGFYNPDNIKIIADAERKRNVILTVGRIGSKQKNSEELLIAFARASNDLYDWSLRLVGPIEPELQTYLDSYFSRRPDLKERVILTGSINSKYSLFKEYARAKVFALTSEFEGGTPNVFAEALVHGCMFITSDIDAADDITNNGELGCTYKLGEYDELTKKLTTLCSDADKRAFQEHIPKARAYAAKYFDWNRNAKKLAYMLYK